MNEPFDDLPPLPHARLKMALLALAFLVLLSGFVLYVLYARGAFEEKQRLVLIAENAEGVSIGMEMTFAGFPLGRVTRIDLGEDGRARLFVETPKKEAKRWLRTSSVFTLERGLVGGARLRAYTGMLTDPPLPDGAEREVLIGDAMSGVPQAVAAFKELLANLERLTAADAPLAGALRNAQAFSARLEKESVATVLLGRAAARDLAALLRESQMLVGRIEARLLDEGGLLAETHSTVRAAGDAARELQARLAEARASLDRLAATLARVESIAANVQPASEDLSALRAEVEADLRRLSAMIDELNRRWPLNRPREIVLP